MLRKIATIATITTATIAMVACSPEPTPETAVEQPTQETTVEQPAQETAMEQSTQDMQKGKTENKKTSQPKDDMNVQLVGEVFLNGMQDDGYRSWREYEVTDSNGNIVQCFGVETRPSTPMSVTCNWDKAK